MCTLVLGLGVAGAGSVLLAANRDERPERPSDPPRVLSPWPRVVGGRDRVAGGTWLAVRERRAVVALLNRRSADAAGLDPGPAPSSRGRLTLDVASCAIASGESPAAAMRLAAAVAFARDAYAPCTLLVATPEGCWSAALRAGRAFEFGDIPPGWHVITHAELDDPDEPRTAWLMRDLAGYAPPPGPDAIEGALARLRLHADANGNPDVCLHTGRMVTVSSAAVWLAGGDARYVHIEGRACTGAVHDVSHLLADNAPAGDMP